MSYAIADLLVDGAAVYPILEFVKMCSLMTFSGTLLVIIIGTLTCERKFQFTKPIMEQLRHLEAAYELIKSHVAAQKAELEQLRSENEQLKEEFELLNKHASVQRTQIVQIQLDNEQLEGLVRTLTLTIKDQEACLWHAEQKAATIKTQNAGLANKLMASRRQVFKLEQERWEQKVLLQGQSDIKTLVKENTTAIRALDGRVNSKCTNLSESDNEQGCGSITPSGHSSSTADPITHARALQHVIRNILVGGCSIESTLTSFLGLDSHPQSPISEDADTTTSPMSADELAQLGNTSRIVKTVKARIYTVTDFACALALARKQFQSQFNIAQCGSQESRRVDSATSVGMLTEISCR